MNLKDIFIALLVLIYSGQANADTKKLPSQISHPSGVLFQLCSQQKITKAIFFDVVQVGLYYPSCPEKLTVFDQKSKLLRFHYLRKVKGKQFKEGAEDYLTYNLNEADFKKCFAKYQALNNSYLDVKDGDYYDLFQLQPIGLDLFLNDKSLASFKDSECEALYYNIWFGKESMSSDFQKLLGH